MSDFINILEKETYIDTLGQELPEGKHWEAALTELLSVMPIDDEDLEQSELYENCFINYELAKCICNSIHFAANRFKRQLENALDELAEAERANTGTEMTQMAMDRSLAKIAGLERKIQKLRIIYKISAYDVFEDNFKAISDVLPAQYTQYMEKHHKPWVPKDKHNQQIQNRRKTSSAAMAQAKLQQYKRG